MVAQVTRMPGVNPVSAPQTLQNGAYTLGQPLCTLQDRTLFTAQQTGVDRPVLIERIAPIAPELAASAFMARQAVLGFEQVNIAQALDVFVEDGALYTVMCAGAGVPMLNHAALTSQQAITYGVDICNSLSYLARHHGHLDAADISPCTVFITRADRARLTSMAALLGVHASANNSRFVARAGDGEQATVFSLGATLHYALSGWAGSYHDDAAPALVGVSPEFNAVLAKALAANPADRFTSISQLRQALLRLQ
ncbi:MAG: hypothetical protein H0X24_08415 [Ktedonobacterales bacterium]|nr:hypothetical protein [Ktedonobacterales bacterium]